MKYVAYSSIASFFFAVASHTALAVNTSLINTTLPGMAGGDNPCQFVFSFYTFALMIGGILAFGAIVYGGVKYTIAAGNPSGQSEGKEWVKGALLGLLLLVGAYLILNVINPDLTKCTLPQLGGVSNATPGSGNMSCTTTGCLFGQKCYVSPSDGSASCIPNSVQTCDPTNCLPPSICILDATTGNSVCSNMTYACIGYQDPLNQSGPLIHHCSTSLSLCQQDLSAPFSGQKPTCLSAQGSCQLVGVALCGK